MSWLQAALDEISSIPLHQFLGVRDLEAANGVASLRMTVNENTINPAGMLHGGVAYALCDVVAFAALLSTLHAGATAVTHDIHLSVMRAARLGDEVTFSARIAKKGKRIAFLDAEAHLSDAHGELIASARVTKSLLQ